MGRRKRIKRSKTDLENELKNQIVLLRKACDSYDEGLKPIGKYIALSLRILLHHQGNSKALLHQLGILENRFLDTAGELNPNNLIADFNLLSIHLGPDGAEYIPRGLSNENSANLRKLRFSDWWNMPVVKAENGAKFSRRKLVLNVADTDGGAHVDPDLEVAYMELSRNNSLGWSFNNGKIETPLGGPELPCMRQIAYEVLELLERKVPQYFTVP